MANQSAGKVDTAHAVSEAQTAIDIAQASGGTAPVVTSATRFNSLDQLRKADPKLYNQLMLSIGQNIIIQLRRGDERLQEEWKKMRENDR